MAKYGLLIDYEYCVGCRACEIACKEEHNRAADEYGIQVQEIQPEVSKGRLYYYPFPTDHCNLCGKRIAKGLEPACVTNCWARVMKFGTIRELAGDMEKKPRNVLWVPR